MWYTNKLCIAVVTSHEGYGVGTVQWGDEWIGKDMEGSGNDLTSNSNPAFNWSEWGKPTGF